MANDKETTASLKDFSFDDDQSFFGIKATASETDQVIKEVKGAETITSDDETVGKEKTSTLKPKAGEEEIEEEDDDEVTFFTDDVKPKEEEEEVDEEKGDKKDKEKPENKGKENEDKDDKFFTTLTAELKEKGIFTNVEIKEDEEITEEQFFELQDKEIEARVEETFEAFFEELDEDAKAFLKFKKNGGKTSDFFSAVSTELPLEELDVEDEAQRIKVLTHYLSTVEKLEPEDVKDRLEWLKEGGKEKAYATKYFKAMKTDSEKAKQAMVEAQEAAATAREEGAKKFNAALVDTLAKTEKVGEFTFSKADQKELGSYITKPTVKVGKNKYIPAFQAEIASIFKADTPEAKQKLLLLGKLVKSNFDVSDMVTATKTKVTKETKSKLQQAKEGVKAATSGQYAKKTLGDFFD